MRGDAVLKRLRKARALFGPNGENYLKGSLKDGGKVCAVGALSTAYGGRPSYDLDSESFHNALMELEKRLPEDTPARKYARAVHPNEPAWKRAMSVVVGFNDLEGRENTLKLFDKTICELEQENKNAD